MFSKASQQKANKKNLKNILEVDRLNFPVDEFNQYREKETTSASESSLPQRKEFTVFSYQQYYEQEIVKKKTKELVEVIKQEIELIKKSNKAFLAEVKDIERLTTETVSEKPGVYHVRFLEVILSILKNLRKKITESKTWLETLMSKKKKRGSLFAFRSKKMGTAYSLSQELQSARSVQ